MFNADNYRETMALLLSAPIYIILIGIEMYLSNKHEQKVYSIKDSFTNLYLMFLNMGIDLALRAIVFIILIYFYQYHLWDFSNVFLYWFLLFIIEDFMFYWLHRVDHSTRLFWAVHVTHHSSLNFNLTTGFRSSVLQPFYRFIYFIPLAFIGFQPLDIFFMYSITQTYGIIIHTQLIHKLGVLEYILVTPSHHRVHHASNIPFLDKNLGMVLIIWDKLFGTFESEDHCDEKIKYGLTSGEELDAPIEVITHEWTSLLRDIKKVKGIFKKIKLLFVPPGWTYEDQSKTSKALQEDYWNTLYKQNNS